MENPDLRVQRSAYIKLEARHHIAEGVLLHLPQDLIEKYGGFEVGKCHHRPFGLFNGAAIRGQQLKSYDIAIRVAALILRPIRGRVSNAFSHLQNQCDFAPAFQRSVVLSKRYVFK